MIPSSKTPPPPLPYLGIFWFVVPLPGEKFLMTFNISVGWGGGGNKSTKLELNFAHFPRFSHTIIWAFFGSVVPHPFFQITPPTGQFSVFWVLKNQRGGSKGGGGMKPGTACTERAQDSKGQSTILYMFLFWKFNFGIFMPTLVQIWKLLWKKYVFLPRSPL